MALAVLSGGPPRELLAAVAARRHRAAAGRARDRQAHRGADRRRAAREGRRRDGDDPIVITRARRPARARPRRAGRARLHARRRSTRCSTARRGDTPEALIAHALKVVAPMIRTPGRRRRPHPDPAACATTTSTRRALRPRRLDEFVGQEALKAQLELSIRAAADARRGDGPRAVRRPAGARQDVAGADRRRGARASAFMQTAGPALERKGDIASFLTDLEPRSVFFVDEIHRLPRAVEETFYPGDGGRPAADHARRRARARRSSRCRSPPFTLIGATTRAGLLTTPLRDRFGIQHRLDHYGAGRPRGDRRPQRRRARRRRAPGRRAGDRRALPRHAARGQPPAQARARLRAGPRRRHDRRRAPPTRRWTCSRSTTRAWTGWTARS